MGRQVFTAGEILTAANMNDLSDQSVMVFDDASARTTAIPTPVEGMVTYLKDTDEVDKFDGADFVPVSPPTGVEILSTTTLSGVSSQSFNDVFTADYDHYLVKTSLDFSNSNTVLTLRMRASGADVSTATYNTINSRFGSSDVTVRSVGATSATLHQNTGTTDFFQDIKFYDPALAKVTGIIDEGGSGSVYERGAHSQTDSTAFDGFTIISSLGTLTGNITIYGWKEA